MCEDLLKEARQVLDDWCDEYGHYELEIMRDKIDKYFESRKTIDNQKIHTAKKTPPLNSTLSFREVFMKASEARKLTEENLNGPLIEPLLKIAFSRIKEFAMKGKYSVPHPFYGAKNYPSKDEQEAAASKLRLQGYKVKFISNPDPGDPRSSDYWEVSW